MILLISYDVRRRGGIERLTMQVQTCLSEQGESIKLLSPQRLGASNFGRQIGRLWFLMKLAWWLPQASKVLSMHALLLRPLRWLSLLRPRAQSLYCWMHGIEVWGAALEDVREDLLNCTGLIASSSFTRCRVQEQAGTWPTISVVNPMADLISETERPSAFPKELRLLTVARMEKSEGYKGHHLVLEALARLLREGTLPPDLTWRIVGEGEDRCNLEQECKRLGLKSWICFLGAISDYELREELRNCSLLLMPSSYGIKSDGRACGEGFGIAYLEAAHAGRASIACRQGGHADLIIDKETGWLIEPKSEHLACLLLKIYSDPGILIKAGHAAHARAHARFNRQVFSRSLLTSLRVQNTSA